MSVDSDFDTWRRQWLAEAASAESADASDTGDAIAALKARVARETRLIKVGLIAPIAVTVVIGGGTVLLARRSADVGHIVLAIEVWAFILVTWAGSLWIARRTWRPLAETTAAFIDISIRRCESNIVAASFGAWLYVFQLTFVLVWRFYNPDTVPSGLATGWPVPLLISLGLPAFLAWRFWFVRKQRAALAQLLELRRQLVSEA